MKMVMNYINFSTFLLSCFWARFKCFNSVICRYAG